jgi:hypothetical protein
MIARDTQQTTKASATYSRPTLVSDTSNVDDCAGTTRHGGSRRLRNAIIFVNAFVWIAVLIGIRMIFF